MAAEYSDKVVEYYEHPKNRGKLESSDSSAKVVSPVCGDSSTMYLKVKNVDGKEIIEDIGFETMGCAVSVATSSMLTEMVKGKTLDEAMKVTKGEVIGALGGLPEVKVHCGELAIKSLQAAIRNYRSNSPEELKKKITLISPCDTDPNKIIIEVDIGEGRKDYFDGEKLSEILESNIGLRGVKCSLKLSLWKFEVDGKKVHVFKNGKLVIKEADSEEDAIETLSRIKELLSGAINR